MKIEFKDGMIVTVRWHHIRKPRWFVAMDKRTATPIHDDDGKPVVRKDFKPGGKTRCFVNVTFPDGKGYEAQATAHCFELDPYCKAKGRKESLAKALYIEQHTPTQGFLTKQRREEIWAELNGVKLSDSIRV